MDWQLTTDDNGKFQMVIPRRTLEVGRYKLTASFAGDNYYTSASAEKNIRIESSYISFSLSLTGAQVISSGDSTTITATLLGDDSPFNDAVLDYEIKHGNTTISTGTTSATDANGQTTISYTGTGAGDIDIIVSYGNYIEETFIVEDCIVYRETLSTNITDLTLPARYKLEFDMPSTSNSTYAIIGTDTTHRILMGQMSNQNPSLNGVWVYDGSSTPTQNNCPTTPTNNAHYTFIYENNSYTMSNGGSSITGTIPTGINMNNLLSTTYTPSAVRNYKIKAL